MTPLSRPTIDVNLDCGEDPRALEDGTEARLLDSVSSANVACGGHAGDDATMRQVVLWASGRGVAVGAHPSYPDRAGFGRRETVTSLAALEETVASQVARLGALARDLDVRLAHVKPHGALYHAASSRPGVAEAIARAAAAWDPSLVLVGRAGSPALDAWRRLGFRMRAEAFADRAYEPDGSLRLRSLPGALVTSPEEAARRAVAIARGEGATASDGSVVPLAAGTIGLHADTPNALAIARAVRAALESAGFDLRSS